jgi:hypothetical protein
VIDGADGIVESRVNVVKVGVLVLPSTSVLVTEREYVPSVKAGERAIL